MSRGRKIANDALLRNGRQTKQERLEVPSTSEGCGSKHMEHERKLLAKRQMLEHDAKKKYDELDAIFQQIVETNAKIEEQREKQIKKEREREE
jgi:hypothetical protein